jgi:hypothetical protein
MVLANLSSIRRIGRAALALALLAATAFEATRHAAYGWAAIGLLAPDLSLLGGGGPGLAKGQLAARAVSRYNAVHRYWGPIALMLAALPDAVPLAVFIVGLSWATHIAVDRALGFGLRTPDGFQRG